MSIISNHHLLGDFVYESVRDGTRKSLCDSAGNLSHVSVEHPTVEKYCGDVSEQWSKFIVAGENKLRERTCEFGFFFFFFFFFSFFCIKVCRKEKNFLFMETRHVLLLVWSSFLLIAVQGNAILGNIQEKFWFYSDLFGNN